MIERRAKQKVREALARQAAVAIADPRQVGKTTLAQDIVGEQPSVRSMWPKFQRTCRQCRSFG